MTRTILLLAFWLVLSGCDGSAKSPARAPADDGIGGLPYIADKGTRYPYIRYADTDPSSGNGRIFFLHPMMDQRNALLALEAGPNVRVQELFAEDMLGVSGPVSAKDEIISVDFLPISLPIGVAEGREWMLRYAKNDFRCRSRAAASANSALPKLGVSCSSPKYVLNFIFDRERGIEEYQDFCGASICTFRLVDGDGLLSREVLDHMRLPKI